MFDKPTILRKLFYFFRMPGKNKSSTTKTAEQNTPQKNGATFYRDTVFNCQA